MRHVCFPLFPQAERLSCHTWSAVNNTEEDGVGTIRPLGRAKCTTQRPCPNEAACRKREYRLLHGVRSPTLRMRAKVLRALSSDCPVVFVLVMADRLLQRREDYSFSRSALFWEYRRQNSLRAYSGEHARQRERVQRQPASQHSIHSVGSGCVYLLRLPTSPYGLLLAARRHQGCCL